MRKKVLEFLYFIGEIPSTTGSTFVLIFCLIISVSVIKIDQIVSVFLSFILSLILTVVICWVLTLLKKFAQKRLSEI